MPNTKSAIRRVKRVKRQSLVNKLRRSRYKLAIKKINKLYDNGHKIIIFTARFMGRTNNDFIKAKELGYNSTLKQLKNWDLKFHKLIFGKPSFDLLVDDKAYNYNENWINKI